MAKRKSTTAKLAALLTLRGAPPSPELVKELRTALADSSNLVVAEAAELAGTAHVAELVPDLTAAFDRFFEEPEKNDKLCRAKIAIAEALNQLECADEPLFWRGARHVQPEPVWGGEQDTAAPLRASCAFSLVRVHAHGVLPHLVDLLSDPEKTARIGAAQALAYSETEAAGLLLRLKARLGDTEPEVISECFIGLLKLGRDDAVDFVAGFLDAHDQAIQESAVLALGDSRRPKAFEALKKFWQAGADGRIQETVLMALALLCLPQATDFLLDLTATGPEDESRMAISALAIHRYDSRLRDRTATAVAKNSQAGLQAFFEQRFGADENPP
jgi:HEAT repeat protein